MMRFKTILLIMVPILILSCLRGQKEKLADATALLALQEELTSTGEAVVWLRDPDGKITSHWIKNDVSGVILVASRNDAVVPLDGALWRFPIEDRYDDYDDIGLEDLVSREVVSIRLDDGSEENSDIEDDAGVEDAGVQDQGETGEIEDGEVKICEHRSIQSLPVLLGGIGTHIFIKYQEKQYDCQNVLFRAEDMYLTYDLAERREKIIVDDSEIDKLSRIPSVKNLGRDAEYIGSAPVYDGLSNARLSHVFAYRNSILQENGDRHWVSDAVEVVGEKLPPSLAPYEAAPDLISGFTAMYPMSIPAGWWPIKYEPNEASRLMNAFLE